MSKRNVVMLCGVCVFATSVFAAPMLTSARAAAEGTDLVLTYSFSETVNGADVTFTVHGEKDAPNENSTAAGKVDGATVTGRLGLAKVAGSANVTVTALLTLNGATTQTPAITFNIDAAAEAAKAAACETRLAEASTRLKELQDQVTTLSEKANKAASTLPNLIKDLKPLRTTPLGVLLHFETWKSSNKQEGRVQVELKDPAGNTVASGTSDYAADHQLWLRVPAAAEERSFKYFARVLDHTNTPDDSTTINGTVAIPPQPTSIATAITPKAVSDRSVVLNIKPGTKEIVQIERLEGTKSVQTYGDLLANLDKWKLPAPSSEHDQPYDVEIPGLLPDTDYYFKVTTVDDYGQSTVIPSVGPFHTAKLFDFDDTAPITMEINQLGYVVKWQTTSDATTADFRLVYPATPGSTTGVTTDWITATKTDSRHFIATLDTKNLKAIIALPGFPNVELKIANELTKNTPLVRVVRVDLSTVTDNKQIASVVKTADAAVIKNVYDAANGKKRVNWGRIAEVGLKALLVALQ